MTDWIKPVFRIGRLPPTQIRTSMWMKTFCPPSVWAHLLPHRGLHWIWRRDICRKGRADKDIGDSSGFLCKVIFINTTICKWNKDRNKNFQALFFFFFFIQTQSINFNQWRLILRGFFFFSRTVFASKSPQEKKKSSYVFCFFLSTLVVFKYKVLRNYISQNTCDFSQMML